jgi:hypothetical protein
LVRLVAEIEADALEPELEDMPDGLLLPLVPALLLLLLLQPAMSRAAAPTVPRIAIEAPLPDPDLARRAAEFMNTSRLTYMWSLWYINHWLLHHVIKVPRRALS